MARVQPGCMPTTRELTYERGAVLLVAGVPGSGKTTLLRRVASGPGVVVLDSDDVRRGMRSVGVQGRLETLLRPLVHLGHLVRVVRAVLGVGGDRISIVVHESGTRPRVRRSLARLAARAGRPIHAIFLDVDPLMATVAQRDRGRRPVSARGMARHERSWRALRARLHVGGGLLSDGFASARALDRATAACIERIRFT
jgi:predicted kinase